MWLGAAIIMRGIARGIRAFDMQNAKTLIQHDFSRHQGPVFQSFQLQRAIAEVAVATSQSRG